MSDVEPKKPTTPRGRIAQCIRHLGVAERGVRVNAWRVLVRTMEAENFSFNDIGNWIDDSENKYTEAEMDEFAQAARAEGIEEGIKIGSVRANGGHGNGHLSLPNPSEMATYCNDRQSQLNDWERNFMADMVLNTQGSGRTSPFLTRWNRGLKPKQLGTLAKIYIQLDGAV